MSNSGKRPVEWHLSMPKELELPQVQELRKNRSAK